MQFTAESASVSRIYEHHSRCIARSHPMAVHKPVRELAQTHSLRFGLGLYARSTTCGSPDEEGCRNDQDEQRGKINGAGRSDSHE